MSAWMGQGRATLRTHLPRYAGAAVDRARLTVVPRRAARAPRMPFMILVAVVLLGGVVGLLMFNTSMQQASFTASTLQARADALHAREQSLQMQVDRLRDPQRVAFRAEKLGMVPLVNPAFIRLGDGTELGDAKPAAAGDEQRITPLPTRRPPSFRLAPVLVPADTVPDTGVAGVPTDPAGPMAGRRGGHR